MRVFRIAALFCLATAASAQVPTETLYPGLSGPALLEALRTGEPVPLTHAVRVTTGERTAVARVTVAR